MATDVAAAADRSGQLTVTVPRAAHRRRGWLLVAAMVFNLWLWGTRIANLIGDADGFTPAFIAVHAVLYVSAIGVAVVVGAIGGRMVAQARRADVATREPAA